MPQHGSPGCTINYNNTLVTRFTSLTRRLWSMATALCLAIAVHATSAMELPVDGTEASNDTVETTVGIPEARPSLRGNRTPVTRRSKRDVKNENTIQAVNAQGDTLTLAGDTPLDSITDLAIVNDAALDSAALGKKREFNPDPTTALWMSALCPGLGQVYNRRYWKLPIVVGAFVGLTYGTTWNNRMLNDYSRAYRDAMDNDPETRSYMNFYPPNVKETDLDMAWLQKALKNKKDYFRRYRDICILSMVAVYALSVIDAYVDASLAHFDISPDLTMQVAPTMLDDQFAASRTPSLGVQCAINF